MEISKLKIIINTSNLNKGGGIQVAYSFIHECIKFSNNEYHIFLCKKLSEQIDFEKFDKNFHFYTISNPPSYFSIKGLKTIKILRKLEDKITPDCVFSIFGPSYWTPKNPHLMGFAIAHFIYPDSPFYQIISKTEKFKWNVHKFAKGYFFKRNAPYFHVESEDVRIRLAEYLKINIENIYTVSNTYNSEYTNRSRDNALILSKEPGDFQIVCISAYYTHKNLEILNKVVPLLKREGLNNIKFILTIEDHFFEKIFTSTAKSQIINIGPIEIKKCPQLYEECDATFLPTLLECFSANYPESMIMRKPILTSDLSFAREVCGDAALYFNPLNEKDIVNKVAELYNNKDLYENLTVEGNKKVKTFPNAEKRAENYLNICQNISKKNM